MSRKRLAGALVAGGISVGCGVSFLHARKEAEMAAALRARNLAKRFPGRTAVVLGATSGIGEGCAIRLAEAGYSVVAVGRDAKRGASVVEKCKQLLVELINVCMQQMKEMNAAKSLP